MYNVSEAAESACDEGYDQVSYVTFYVLCSVERNSWRFPVTSLLQYCDNIKLPFSATMTAMVDADFRFSVRSLKRVH